VSEQNVLIWSVACSFYRKVLMVTQPVTKHTALQRVNASACGSAFLLPTQLLPVSSCMCVCVCVCVCDRAGFGRAYDVGLK